LQRLLSFSNTRLGFGSGQQEQTFNHAPEFASRRRERRHLIPDNRIDLRRAAWFDGDLNAFATTKGLGQLNAFVEPAPGSSWSLPLRLQTVLILE
jgi:hypothetical protein